MEIHIIRHIEPAIEKGICYGQTDILLHDGYEKTHKQIAKNIDTDFSQIYSSPLLRCKLLAQEISKDVIYDVRLMEVNFGDWEMKKWDEINEQTLNIWMENYIEKAPPNGESLNDLIYRFKNFVTEKKQDKKILVVAHAGIIRCAFYLFNKIAIDKIMMIKIEHGIIYKFNYKIK
jgi:alpha-ribazole phosphatase